MAGCGAAAAVAGAAEAAGAGAADGDSSSDAAACTQPSQVCRHLHALAQFCVPAGYCKEQSSTAASWLWSGPPACAGHFTLHVGIPQAPSPECPAWPAEHAAEGEPSPECPAWPAEHAAEVEAPSVLAPRRRPGWRCWLCLWARQQLPRLRQLAGAAPGSAAGQSRRAAGPSGPLWVCAPERMEWPLHRAMSCLLISVYGRTPNTYLLLSGVLGCRVIRNALQGDPFELLTNGEHISPQRTC